MLSKLFHRISRSHRTTSQSILLTKIEKICDQNAIQLHYATKLSGNFSAKVFGYFLFVIRALQRSQSELESQQQKMSIQSKHIDKLQVGKVELQQKIVRLERLVAKLSQAQSQRHQHRACETAKAHPTESEQAMRKELVLAMNLALQYWQTHTQENKLSFATKSGLWRVYVDRGTPQTRTLDKYLAIHTLPKSPRWRSVLQSIDYILQHCQTPSQDRAQLIKLQHKFTQYFY